MQGMHFTYSVHFGGTLAANQRGEFILPFAAELVAVSFGNSAASDATLEVGTSADRDGILDAVAIGDSGTPTEYEYNDWNGALATAGVPYRFNKGDILAWDLDFDGAAGTAAANCSIVFTFSEG
jgi:hypothetical protein